MNICVLFGGESEEHEVSCSTAKNIIDNLDRNEYDIYTLGITKCGEWRLTTATSDEIASGDWERDSRLAYITPDRTIHGIVAGYDKIKIDVVYLALHGTNGEDGTVQGLLEMAGIPYTGSGVLASAICMDKHVCRLALRGVGINCAKYIAINKDDCDKIQMVRADFKYPVFVKPSNSGSSIGISKVHSDEDLQKALDDAFSYDSVALVEEFIDGREFEVGVIGNRELESTIVGEVLTDSEFYDYEAKYTAGGATVQIPADITEEQTSEIQDAAKKAYSVLGCRGLCRVDFFIENGTGRIILSELNTLPGCTSTSAFPILWRKSGVPFGKVLDRIIDYALE